MSAPKSTFSCGPSDGKKHEFDPGVSRHMGPGMSAGNPDENRAELKVKVTNPNLRNLRFSVKISVCAISCALQVLESTGEQVNQQKSAVFCENLRWGPLGQSP